MKAWGVAAALVVLVAAPAGAFEPHRSYTTVTKNANTTDAQTDATLWDPAAGKSVALQGCAVSTDATETIQVEVSDVDVIPPIYLAANTGMVVTGGYAPIYMGAVDAILTYTTTTSANTSIVCWGYEF